MKKKLPVDLQFLSTHARAHVMRNTVALTGAVAGIAVGSLQGLLGSIIGAVLGATIGGFAGQTLDTQETKNLARDKQLDRDIGVSEGDMGAASSNPKPSPRGRYSANGVWEMNPEEPAESTDELLKKFEDRDQHP